MTREEQIRQAAEEHFAHSWSGTIKDAFAEGAQWADEQNKQENHLRYNFRKNHQDYLDREREETIEFVQDWLTDNTDINEWLIENLVEAMREANATKQRIERRKRE